MVGGKGNDGVSKRGFSEYGSSHICRGSVYRYVRKLEVLSFSVSAVNCSFGCRELKWSRIFCVLEWLESNIRSISYRYLQ